jgi:glycyl-tRNA synthetase beta chain
MDFIRDRLAVYLREDGVPYDLVDAALAVGIDDVSRAEKRASLLYALGADRTAPNFLPTVIACTRPMNITKGFEGAEVDPKLFTEDAERELWSAYQQVVSESEGHGLGELFRLIAGNLRAPIDTFFDAVLVMAEDGNVRRNRLAICWHLSQLFRRLADFTLIVQV